ncbi:MAG: hypothetical protein V4693_20690 [Pseudomonadota bacterium]
MEGKLVQAKKLSSIELKMLDTGAPVIVPCKTLSGETVNVRLQTVNMESDLDNEKETDNKSTGRGRAKGYWLAHGAYVAVMPSGSAK